VIDQVQAELKPLFVREGLMYVPSCQSPVLKARWYLQLAFARGPRPPVLHACLDPYVNRLYSTCMHAWYFSLFFGGSFGSCAAPVVTASLMPVFFHTD